MKRIFVSALALTMMAGAARAQKGTVLVGGNVDFTSENKKAEDEKTTTLEFNPTVGYQFNNNWTAGITSSVFSQKITTNTVTEKGSGFGVGPFIRYAQPLSNMFACMASCKAFLDQGNQQLPFQHLHPAVHLSQPMQKLTCFLHYSST